MENNFLYPFLDYVTPLEKEIPIASEYAYDMDKAQFKLDKYNHTYLVYKNDAIEIKIWKLFMTERFKEVVFPWSYGHELLSLIGQAYTQGLINSEAERFINEAIFKNLSNYIKRLEDMKIYFEEGILYCDFRAVTIYGDLNMNGLKVTYGII